MINAAPSIVIDSGDGQPREFRGQETIVIGRSPECQIRVDHSLVSRHHAQIALEGDTWVLRDLGSRNGMFIGPTHVVGVSLVEPCTIRLGNPSTGPWLALRPALSGDQQQAPQPHPPQRQPVNAQAQQARQPSSVHAVSTRVRLGRAPDNDVVLTDLLVSRHHTEVRRSDAGFEVVDLGSRNGTYVNGQRVSRTRFEPGDLLSVGHHQFVLRDQQLVEYVDEGRVSLQAEELSVAVGKNDTLILDHVGFSLDECNLLAVVGPSGAGKSTLLNALTGARPAQSGRVIYEGRDLYDNYEDLRHRIGLVPQDDILHRQLTVRRALEYAAALRFPDDVSKAERQSRIQETCASLDLVQHIDKKITQLSGGQRKRVSVALELLTQPSLLFLDEPTSGLDPGLDKQVMTELRRLSDEGRTVIVVTHSVLNLDLCDRVLLLAPGGKTAYFGPPGKQLLDHFGVGDYASVFQQVTNEPTRWQHAYRQSPLYRQYGAPSTANDFERPANSANPTAPPRQQGIFRQLAILCRRMISITIADKPYAAFVFGSPFILALLAHTVPGSDGLARPMGIPGKSGEAQQMLIMLVVGAALMGTAVAIRELVSELPIYRRERAVGLSPSAYLASKLVVFGVINVIQAFVLVLLGLAGRRFPTDPLILPFGWLEVVVACALMAITSTALGLMVSARVSSSQQTMPVLVVIVMSQLVFSCGLFKIIDRVGLEQFSWLFPARWGYAAIAATSDLRKSMRIEFKDPLWVHDPKIWLLDMGILLGMTIVFVLATRLLLLAHEPTRGRKTTAAIPPVQAPPLTPGSGPATGQYPQQPPQQQHQPPQPQQPPQPRHAPRHGPPQPVPQQPHPQPRHAPQPQQQGPGGWPAPPNMPPSQPGRPPMPNTPPPQQGPPPGYPPQQRPPGW